MAVYATRRKSSATKRSTDYRIKQNCNYCMYFSRFPGGSSCLQGNTYKFVVQSNLGTLASVPAKLVNPCKLFCEIP